MKLVFALVTGLAVFAAASTQGVISYTHRAPHKANPAEQSSPSHAPRHATSQTASSAGTVSTVTQHGLLTVIAVTTSGRLLNQLVVSARQSIVTRDGRKLAATDVRSGDALLVRADGRIEDLSQFVTDITGIVSTTPGSVDGPIVVHRNLSEDIVVDAGPQTRFIDPSNKATSLLYLEDADQVQAHGVLDLALGEMTETDSIVRLGP